MMATLDKKIIIGSRRQILNYVKLLLKETDWEWCYFGLDIKQKHKIETKFSKDRRYHYAKELHKLSYDLRTIFLDWIARVNCQYKDYLQWWAARLPSKSPYQTDFFLLFCYFHLIKNWLLESSFKKEKLMIIIEDPYLHKLLKRQIATGEYSRVLVKSANFRIFISKNHYYIKSILARVLFFVRGISNLLVNTYLKIRFSAKFKLINKYSPDFMVFTHLNNRSFEEGNFKDVYNMDRLAELYENSGKKVIMAFLNNIAPLHKYSLLKSSKVYFLPDFYLKIRDSIKIMLMQPIFNPKEKLYFYDNQNYKDLFFRDYLHEISSTSFWIRLSLYYAYKNYFSRNKQIKYFIYLFENQPWEKMVLRALGSCNHKAISVGYQHTSVPVMEMNHFLGTEEYKFSPAPNYIVACNTYYKNMLNSCGFNNSKIVVGGSLRFGNRQKRQEFDNKKNSRSEKNILFLLPSSLSHSLEVIYSMVNVVSKNKGFKFKLFVKPHPVLFNTVLKKQIKKIADSAVICFSPLDEILGKMDLVVYSFTTATLEVLDAGIPVYKINSELLDLDMLDDFEIKPYKMTDNQEIDLDLVDFDKNISFITDDILGGPIKKETWLSFL